jgi:hypothetical protein
MPATVERTLLLDMRTFAASDLVVPHAIADEKDLGWA